MKYDRDHSGGVSLSVGSTSSLGAVGCSEEKMAVTVIMIMIMIMSLTRGLGGVPVDHQLPDEEQCSRKMSRWEMSK